MDDGQLAGRMLERMRDYHAFICGQTQSGKSYGVHQLIDGFPRDQRRVVIDPKGEMDRRGTGPVKRPWPLLDQVVTDDPNRVVRLLDDPHCPTILYQPPYAVAPYVYHDLLWGIWEWVWEHKRGSARKASKYVGLLLVLDEVHQVTPIPYPVPMPVATFLQMGLGVRARVWSINQRPSGIPIALYSEAYTRLVWHLERPIDRKLLASETGIPEMLADPREPYSESDPRYRSAWLAQKGRAVRIHF